MTCRNSAAPMAPANCTAQYGTTHFGGNTPRPVKAKVTAGLMCSPDSGPHGKYLHHGDARGSRAVHDDDQQPSEVGGVSDGGRRGADCTSRDSSATLRLQSWLITLTRC